MNPHANERVLETGPLAAPRHQQASPRGISEPVKRVSQNAVRQLSGSEKEKGKTFEHGAVFTRELMSRLGKPRFDEHNRSHMLSLPLLHICCLPLVLTTLLKFFIQPILEEEKSLSFINGAVDLLFVWYIIPMFYILTACRLSSDIVELKRQGRTNRMGLSVEINQELCVFMAWLAWSKSY